MKLETFFIRPFSTFPHWIIFLSLALSIFGCSRSLHWVHESEEIPSCIPDRLPTWDDYPRQDGQAKESAITAVIFNPKHSPPKIEMRFDIQRSWVKASIVDPWNPEAVNVSKRMLLHEQLHYMISCLETRRANQTLQNGGDSLKMAQKVKDKAKRFNLQYDKDTNHGLNNEAQLDWERKIQQQLRKLSIKQARGF